MIDNRRDDLVELPSDCELPAMLCPPGKEHRVPTEALAVADVGHHCSSYLLRPCRTVQQAARDILRRQLEQSPRQTDNVVELAHIRATRKR